MVVQHAFANAPHPPSMSPLRPRPPPQVSARHAHLDLLINASGVLHDAELGMSPETALQRVTMASLTRCFHVNAAGHILVCKAFAPLLSNAAKANGATE